MSRRMSLPLVLGVLITVSWASSAQDRVAPFYSLPADGSQVEYDWSQRGPDDRFLAGVLCLRVTGTKQEKEQTQRRVEIELTLKGKDRARQLRKLLVAEPLAPGRPLSASVIECLEEAEGGKFVRLSESRTRDFLAMGFSPDRGTLREVRANEEVET